MTEEMLVAVCKKLRFNSGIVAKAKKIKKETHMEFLLELLTKEAEERERKRNNSYIKAAKFDLFKTFEEYTFEDIKFPDDLTADDLFDSTFIPRKANLIMYGTVGAGKTHLAIAIGVAACDAGFRTRFWRTANLVNALVEAKNQGTLTVFMKQFEKLDLLICDEWGYVPIDLEGSKLLFNVISECCERKSLIVTTNLEYGRWNEIFAHTKITAALLDRVIHNSHLLDFTNRESRRLRAALLRQSQNNSENTKT